jgi:hypothetical protein
MPSKAFLRSLFLAAALSFIAPLFLISGIMLVLFAVTYIPGLEAIGSFLVTQLLRFLATFGDGRAYEGVLVIGTACSFVGALFDTYVYYYRYLRDS